MAFPKFICLKIAWSFCFFIFGRFSSFFFDNLRKVKYGLMQLVMSENIFLIMLILLIVNERTCQMFSSGTVEVLGFAYLSTYLSIYL